MLWLVQLSVRLRQSSDHLIIVIITFDETVVKGLNPVINVGRYISNFFELPCYLGAELHVGFLLHF
jgi:hypothetical protein